MKDDLKGSVENVHLENGGKNQDDNENNSVSKFFDFSIYSARVPTDYERRK